MRIWPVALLSVAACIAATCIAQQPNSQSTPQPTATSEPHPAVVAAALTREDLEAWLDGLIPYALERADVAGAVVVVVKDGQVLLQKGYGFSDYSTKQAVDPEYTLFRAGSVSKLFTWTAVMQLVEEKRIRLDEDVNAYLDFRIPPFNGQPVTMRELMTHTAGFQDSLKEVITPSTSTLELGAFLKRQVPARIFPPGTVPAYSNYGAGVAGYIVQRISGQSFEQYVEQHILGPLDMAHTTFLQPPPAEFAPHVSRGYLSASEAPVPFETLGLAPAGGISVSGADMAKFMLAHLQEGEYAGHRILQPATAHLMHSDAMTTVSPRLNRMVLGFFQSDRNGHRVIGHDGDTRVFHSALSLFLDDHVGLFVSLNSAGQNADTYAIREALFNGFCDRYFPGSTVSGSVPLVEAKTHAALMAGHYDGSRREQTTFVSLLTLFSQVTVAADESGRLVTSLTSPNGVQKIFQEIAPFVWREVSGDGLLAAKVIDHRVTLWAEGNDASLAYTPTPWWRNASWLRPLLLLSIAAVLLTTIAWPVGAITRRRYGVTLAPADGAARARRWLHIAVAAECVVIVGWGALIFGMIATFFITYAPYFISASMEKWILILHLLTLVVFPLAALVGLWNVWVRFAGPEGRRPALARLSSLVIAISTLTLLWVGVTFHLIGLSLAF